MEAEFERQRRTNADPASPCSFQKFFNSGQDLDSEIVEAKTESNTSPNHYSARRWLISRRSAQLDARFFEFAEPND